MSTISLPSPTPDELVGTNLIVGDDVEASARFCTDVLGGTLVRSGQAGPTIVTLANAWITLANGGGPTPDTPTVNLACSAELDQVDGFPNLRVADIDAVYREWASCGAAL